MASETNTPGTGNGAPQANNDSSRPGSYLATGKCMIVGLGNIGMQLVKLLSRDLELICLDNNEQTLETARQLRGEALPTFHGDATSRMALEKAGVGKVDTVVITTTTEAVNIEVARILHEHFEVPRVLAVGITQSGIARLEEYGVEVENIFAVSATGLRNRLEYRTKTVTGIGLGKNEILQVEVHGHSRLAGKPLAALNPRSWRIGIVYREGNIIIPKGETVLRAKDRVVILGDPKVLKTVTDLLTFRFKHFPLEFGDTLVAHVPAVPAPNYLEEVAYLLSVFPLERVLFVCGRRDERLEDRLRDIGEKQHVTDLKIETAPAAEPCAAVRDAVRELGRRASMVVLPREEVMHRRLSLFADSAAKACLGQLSEIVGCPVLLAAGTFPYERVAVPAVEPAGLQHALETTLEMSAAIRYRIDALFVNLSRYIASEEESQADEAMRTASSDLGLVYRASVRQVDLEGNPIRSLGRALDDYNLMVNDVGSWRSGSHLLPLLRPDVAWGVVRRSRISTLLIPPSEIIA
jgi:Trk K+ transport system NAD-binding subunit